MANSLSDWLADMVTSCIASREDGLNSDQQDRQSLLGDIAFEKGLGVQILRFFTPQVAQQAHQELLHSYQKGLGSQHRAPSYDGQKEGDSSSDDSGPLCAIVADKANWIHVQISRHCVARFNSTNSRTLISLRGSVIHIKGFRPSMSFLPSLLDSVQQNGGPFERDAPIIKPSLMLEIESMQVVGAINEVQFWPAKQLQTTLLSEDTPASPFKQWFKQVEKIMTKEQKRRRKRLEEERIDLNTSQSSKRKSAKSSSGSDTVPAVPASVPLPPPFQRPLQVLKRARQQEPSQGSASTASSKSTRRAPRGSWGDFTLTQGYDEFGLDAAASQLIERHEQGLDTFEGQFTADSLDTHSIYPSLPLDGILPDNLAVLPENDSRSSRQKQSSSSGQDNQQGMSQDSPRPASFPKSSPLIENSRKENDIGPPSITDSTSLPFSFGMLSVPSSTEPGKHFDEVLQAPSSLHSNRESRSVQQETTRDTHLMISRLKPKSKRESIVQTDGHRETGIMTSPIERCKAMMKIAEQHRINWIAVRSLPPENLGEREDLVGIELDTLQD